MHACKLHVQCLMGWWWWTLDGGRMSCVCDTSGNGFCENENCRYSWLKSIRLHYYSLVRPSPCYSTWTVHHCCSCCCFFFRFAFFRFLVSSPVALFCAISFRCCILSHGFLFFMFCCCFLMPKNSLVLFLFRTFNCCPEFEKAKLCAFERNNFNPFMWTHTHTNIALTSFVKHPFNHPSQPNENWVT